MNTWKRIIGAAEIDLRLIDGFSIADLSVGDRFDILRFGGALSGFENLTLNASGAAALSPNLDNMIWRLAYDGSSVYLTIDEVLEEAVMASGTSSTGETGGGSDTIGGLDVLFDDILTPGTFTADYETADAAELADLIPPAAEPLVNFQLPGSTAQVWNIDFDGTFVDFVTITLGYDETLLDIPEADLLMYHYTSGAWELVTDGFVLDTIANTMTFNVDSFSPFMLGGASFAAPVPEPSTYAMAAIGLLGLGFVVRKKNARRRQPRRA